MGIEIEKHPDRTNVQADAIQSCTPFEDQLFGTCASASRAKCVSEACSAIYNCWVESSPSSKVKKLRLLCFFQGDKFEVTIVPYGQKKKHFKLVSFNNMVEQGSKLY